MAPIFPIWWQLTIILAFATDRGYGITGGDLVNITDLPHQVYIKLGRTGYLCGGSIVSSQHVLTLAECVIEPPANYVVVAATDEARSGGGGDEYAVTKIAEHPDEEGDIAVLTLAKGIILSDKARPIALAGTKHKIADGAELIASGWGRNEQFLTSDKLRKVTISKVSDDECKQFFGNIDPAKGFCAGGEGRSACWFDEGGPLIESTSKGKVLVGVIRGLNNCKEDNKRKHTLFTRLSTFSKWIKKVVKADLKPNEEHSKKSADASNRSRHKVRHSSRGSLHLET